MASIELVPMSEEETERLKQVYPNQFVRLGQRYVRLKPSSCVIPVAFEKFKHEFKNWKIRPDDVYVLTFAKNGTTWTQELVWCLQNGCDIEKAKAGDLEVRSPFLDMTVLSHHLKRQTAELEFAKQMESPRVLKSHLPFTVFPDDLLDKSKVVVSLRNPKDTVVSFYHHEQLIKLHDYQGSFQTYFDMFMENMLLYSPYFEYVTEAWKRRQHPNLCLLFFEEMKADLEANVRKVAKFLGKEVNDEQVETLLEHLSFRKMKENATINKKQLQNGIIFNQEGDFLRKGEVGDWKNYFTEEMNKRMDEAIEKHLKPMGLEFRYE